MKLNHMQHKHGGRIVSIDAIAHSVYKGAAEWHYVGAVEWSDGTASGHAEIAPWALCYDHDNTQAHLEFRTLNILMGDYLIAQGEWHDPRSIRGGRIVHWTPKEKEHSLIVTPALWDSAVGQLEGQRP